MKLVSRRLLCLFLACVHTADSSAVEPSFTEAISTHLEKNYGPIKNLCFDSDLTIEYSKSYVDSKQEPFASGYIKQTGKFKLIFDNDGSFGWIIERFKSSGELMFKQIAQYNNENYQEFDVGNRNVVVSKSMPDPVPISYLFHNPLFMPYTVVEDSEDF